MSVLVHSRRISAIKTNIGHRGALKRCLYLNIVPILPSRRRGGVALSGEYGAKEVCHNPSGDGVFCVRNACFMLYVTKAHTNGEEQFVSLSLMLPPPRLAVVS